MEKMTKFISKLKEYGYTKRRNIVTGEEDVVERIIQRRDLHPIYNILVNLFLQETGNTYKSSLEFDRDGKKVIPPKDDSITLALNWMDIPCDPILNGIKLHEYIINPQMTYLKIAELFENERSI